MDEREALQTLQQRVGEFEGGAFEGPPETDEGEKERLRAIGMTLWRSPKHGQTVMLHAYAALFGIPAFVHEAHCRQPGRFNTNILFSAVQNTASNLWQAFWFDFDAQNRPVPRDLIPLTGVLNVLHGPQPTSIGPRRPRISDLPMAFFVFQAIRGVEYLAERDGIGSPELFEQHYRHLATIVQRAGYRFPNERARIEALCRDVDALLTREDQEAIACWQNLFAVADRLGIGLTVDSVHAFLLPLLPNEARLFEKVFLSL